MNATKNSTQTSVYRYFDRDGLLLYVGITSRGTARQHEHNGTKSWWGHVANQEVEHYDTRQEALLREKALIKAFRPPFNTTHNLDPNGARDAYLASMNAAATGEIMKKITLDRAGEQENRLWFTSSLDHAPTVSRIDMAYQSWIGPRKQGKVLEIWRTGALLSIQVEQRAPIEALQVILRYYSQVPTVLQIKKITPLMADTDAQ